MAASHLTARSCAAARPKVGADGKAVQTAFPDDDPIGLELRVSAEGRKVWSYRYRTLDGRQRRLTLGVFAGGEDDVAGDEEGDARPLTLKAARRKARQARAVVEDGGDPATVRRKAKEAANAQALKTFDDVADAYLLACRIGEWKPKGRKKRERTVGDEEKILKRYVRPALGKMAIEDVSRAGIKKVLRGMVARGISAQTNRTHAVIRQIFAWAVAEERVAANPAIGFAPMATEAPRVRTLTDAEMKTIWATIKAPSGLKIIAEGEEPRSLYVSRPVAIILQLATLLLQRRSEVAGMRRAEINLAERTWLIPAERAKGGRPHLVPLTDRAVELIKEALQLADFGREKPSECVFPGRRDLAKSIGADSVSHSLSDVAKASGVEGVTVHDLRRTGASAMASERLAIAPHVISRVLGHSGDHAGAAAVTMAHYAQYDFLPEKRRALESWEGLLLEVVGELQRPLNVEPMARRRG